MQHILGKVITLLLITVTMTYASNENNVYSLEKTHYTITEEQSYKHMSTAQLQEEVERRSINGDLSFAMGLELMKRWTTEG